MLMRVKDEQVARYPNCYDDYDSKPSKYDSEWERTLWEAYSYRNPSEDCDTKRTGYCKISQNPQVQSITQ